MELYASYCYQSMAFYFDRDDVALPGFSKFFKNLSKRTQNMFMKYQNKREGRIVLQDNKNLIMMKISLECDTGGLC